MYVQHYSKTPGVFDRFESKQQMVSTSFLLPSWLIPHFTYVGGVACLGRLEVDGRTEKIQSIFFSSVSIKYCQQPHLTNELYFGGGE